MFTNCDSGGGLILDQDLQFEACGILTRKCYIKFTQVHFVVWRWYTVLAIWCQNSQCGGESTFPYDGQQIICKGIIYKAFVVWKESAFCFLVGDTYVCIKKIGISLALFCKKMDGHVLHAFKLRGWYLKQIYNFMYKQNNVMPFNLIKLHSWYKSMKGWVVYYVNL